MLAVELAARCRRCAGYLCLLECQIRPMQNAIMQAGYVGTSVSKGNHHKWKSFTPVTRMERRRVKAHERSPNAENFESPPSAGFFILGALNASAEVRAEPRTLIGVHRHGETSSRATLQPAATVKGRTFELRFLAARIRRARDCDLSCADRRWAEKAGHQRMATCWLAR